MWGLNQKKNTVKLDIPFLQLFKIVATLLLVYLSYQLQGVIILLFFSFILMAATKPAVFFVQRKLGLPEGLSVALVYLTIILLVGGAFYFIGKPLSEELQHFSTNAPELASNLAAKLPFINTNFNGGNVRDLFSNVFSDFGNTLSNAILFTFTAFGALFEFITVVIISIYMLIEREKLLKFLILVTRWNEDSFYSIYEKVETQLGAWVRGQLFLGFIVGFFTYIGLLVLGIKFALPLGVLAGILEIVPIIGPIISAVPIIAVGLSISPVKGLLCLALTILIQQLENHILVPIIMKRAVGLSPVVTIVSILIGSKLFGIVGTVIAVPVAAVISVMINIYLEKHHITVSRDSVNIE